MLVHIVFSVRNTVDRRSEQHNINDLPVQCQIMCKAHVVQAFPLEVPEFQVLVEIWPVADYSEIIRINPDDPNPCDGWGNPYTNQGDAYYKKMDYGHAIADYSQVIEQSESWHHEKHKLHLIKRRAEIYYRMGKYDSTVADYSEVLRLCPEYAAIYHDRGRAYEVSGNQQKADVDFAR